VPAGWTRAREGPRKPPRRTSPISLAREGSYTTAAPAVSPAREVGDGVEPVARPRGAGGSEQSRTAWGTGSRPNGERSPASPGPARPSRPGKGRSPPGLGSRSQSSRPRPSCRGRHRRDAAGDRLAASRRSWRRALRSSRSASSAGSRERPTAAVSGAHPHVVARRLREARDLAGGASSRRPQPGARSLRRARQGSKTSRARGRQWARGRSGGTGRCNVVLDDREPWDRATATICSRRRVGA